MITYRPNTTALVLPRNSQKTALRLPREHLRGQKTKKLDVRGKGKTS